MSGEVDLNLRRGFNGFSSAAFNTAKRKHKRWAQICSSNKKNKKGFNPLMASVNILCSCSSGSQICPLFELKSEGDV